MEQPSPSPQQQQQPQPLTPGVSQRCFSMEVEEATLHFQIIDLGRQYFTWVSAVGPKLGNMYLAIQTLADPHPVVATVLPGSAASTSQSLAQRLALKVNRPVLCSCNLPSNAPMLQAIAERRLLQELTAMHAAAIATPGAHAPLMEGKEGTAHEAEGGSAAA